MRETVDNLRKINTLCRLRGHNTTESSQANNRAARELTEENEHHTATATASVPPTSQQRRGDTGMLEARTYEGSESCVIVHDSLGD